MGVPDVAYGFTTLILLSTLHVFYIQNILTMLIPILMLHHTLTSRNLHLNKDPIFSHPKYTDIVNSNHYGPEYTMP